MAEQTTLGVDDGGPDLERLREHEVDYTPRPVVRQMLDWLCGWWWRSPRTATFLDPSAGAGVFGSEMQRVWPDSFREAVEVRPEMRHHLRRHHQIVHVEPFDPCGLNTYDVIATNPPFSLAVDWIPQLVSLLTPRGVLVLLHRSNFGQSSEQAAVFRAHTPAVELRITGRIGFRGPGENPKTGKPWGTDSHDHSWWVWKAPGGPHPSWTTYQLPELPLRDRMWREIPGTEHQ